MDRLIFLPDLTKKQSEVAEVRSKVVKMPRGSGKTSACFAGSIAFCRGNEEINISIVVKNIKPYECMVDKLKDIDNIDVQYSENGIIVYFQDTKSYLVIGKYRNSEILIPDDTFQKYTNSFFIYSVIYFDSIEPENIFIECDDYTENSYGEFVLDYLDCCVKNRFVFVY